ncbi:MAG: hypothetical protein K0R28_160 [Paenibacillus sp.]|nr:hypothetical protein [Paenibacillus sp.]
MRGTDSFYTLILLLGLFKLHDKSASMMVLGFEPVDKPIIPGRSFFGKGDFLVLTGMFNAARRPFCRPP